MPKHNINNYNNSSLELRSSTLREEYHHPIKPALRVLHTNPFLDQALSYIFTFKEKMLIESTPFKRTHTHPSSALMPTLFNLLAILSIYCITDK